MSDVNSIQPTNVAKMPLDDFTGPTASGSFEKLSKENATQKVEQTETELKQLKLQEASGQIDAAGLDKKMYDLNVQLQKLQNYLKFERDEDSERMVVFIKDRETDEVLRQIPTQEFLAISKSIGQYLEMSKQISEKISPPVGMLTNETV